MLKRTPYRIKFTSPSFQTTHRELRDYIIILHQKCRLANSVIAGYEHKINVLENKVVKLEVEKFPPMDKIKTLPVVAEIDLPFGGEE